MWTKVIHLELAGDLFIGSIILDLGQFNGEDVLPKRIRSNNSTNFVSSNVAEGIKTILDFFIQKFHKHNKHETLTTNKIKKCV